jgi:membrane-bound serine protease (ClpP class)
MNGEWLAFLQGLLVNPNVAYVLLLLGLWAAAAAWTVPGTGFPEAAAIICLLLAVLGLVRLPVNLIGLALMLVSMGLFVADLKLQSTGLGVGAALGLAVGSLLLFRPGTGVALSPWVIGGVTLATFAFFGFALNAAVRAQRLAVKTDPQTIVGAEGVVTSAIDPVGTVQVRSELWTAVADTPIPVGTPVRVVAVEGVRLRVTPL